MNLPYATTFLLIPGGTTAATGHMFRLNSVYDPDYTATGHQPRGYDQWAALYAYYRVHVATYSVTASNYNPDTTDQAQQQLCGSFVSEYSSNVSTNAQWWYDMQEARYSAGFTHVKIKNLNKYSSNIAANNTGTGLYWRGSVNLNSFYRSSSSNQILYKSGADNLYTPVGTNPSNLVCYLQVFTGMPDMILEQAAVACTARFNFTVEFTDANFITGS